MTKNNFTHTAAPYFYYPSRQCYYFASYSFSRCSLESTGRVTLISEVHYRKASTNTARRVILVFLFCKSYLLSKSNSPPTSRKGELEATVWPVVYYDIYSERNFVSTYPILDKTQWSIV